MNSLLRHADSFNGRNLFLLDIASIPLQGFNWLWSFHHYVSEDCITWLSIRSLKVLCWDTDTLFFNIFQFFFVFSAYSPCTQYFTIRWIGHSSRCNSISQAFRWLRIPRMGWWQKELLLSLCNIYVSRVGTDVSNCFAIHCWPSHYGLVCHIPIFAFISYMCWRLCS